MSPATETAPSTTSRTAARAAPSGGAAGADAMRTQAAAAREAGGVGTRVRTLADEPAPASSIGVALPRSPGEQALVVLPDNAADLDGVPRPDSREGRCGRGTADAHLAGTVVDRNDAGPRRRDETGHGDVSTEVLPEPGNVDATWSGPG